MASEIIDMRSRPAFLHDFYGATPGTKEYDVVKWLNRRVGSKNDEHFTRSKNVKGFVDEIRECGIRTAVIVGRDVPGIRHTNQEIHQLIGKHKELVGMGSVILDGAEIGSQCLIGARTLVPQGARIPPGSFVLGTPARVTRMLTAEERSALKGWAEKYVRIAEYYLAHEINVSSAPESGG